MITVLDNFANSRYLKRNLTSEVEVEVIQLLLHRYYIPGHDSTSLDTHDRSYSDVFLMDTGEFPSEIIGRIIS